ncbi:MAG TPA: MFS transporter [Jatrophihabitantaceae bacterium]|jgi:EmrB/QacA subfamily drug resistance transporter
MTSVLERRVQDVQDMRDRGTRRADRESRRLGKQWTGFAVVLAAMIMNITDSTIVNVAAPSIQRDLSMSTSALEWIAAAYTLAIAVGLLTGGRLGDMFGRKRMLMVGLSGFVLSSAACAFAWSSESLIAARVIQGLSAAALTPQCFGLIRDLFPPAQMGKAFAALGPVIGLSTVAGPVVAGLLIKADVLGTDWRALFLINLPIGAFALLVGARVLPAAAPRRNGLRLDAVGTVLMALASFLIVFPLVDGRSLGWPAWIFGVLAAAVPVLVAFGGQQRHRVRRGRSPLIEFSVLRKRSYASGIVFVLVFFGTVVGFGLTVGLFLQVGLGYSPLTASLYSAGLAVGAFLGTGVGAWAATAVGRPILHIGLAIMAVGTAVLYFSLRAVDGGVGVGVVAPGLVIFGFGMGMIFVPVFSIIMGEIDDHEVGSASGLLESLQQLGASLGVAVLATLFFGKIRLEDGGPGAARAAGRHLVAAQDTLLITLVLIAVAFAVGWLLPRQARTSH